jgi:hypothetical protein
MHPRKIQHHWQAPIAVAGGENGHGVPSPSLDNRHDLLKRDPAGQKGAIRLF